MRGREGKTIFIQRFVLYLNEIETRHERRRCDNNDEDEKEEMTLRKQTNIKLHEVTAITFFLIIIILPCSVI